MHVESCTITFFCDANPELTWLATPGSELPLPLLLAVEHPAASDATMTDVATVADNRILVPLLV